MEYKVEELSSVQRRVTVTVPAEDVDKTIDATYGRLRKEVKIKGFRQGKVPRKVLEQYYAPKVLSEVAETLVSAYFSRALGEAKLEPVTTPSLEPGLPAPGQPYEFFITLDVKPEFELAKEQYQGMELKEPNLEASDEVVEDSLNRLLERQAVLEDIEESRPAAMGDVVVVSYQSFDGESEIEGGTAENVEIELGGGKVADEIDTALTGAKIGEIVEAVFPYDANGPKEDLHGKDITMKLFVKGLKKKVLPAADDEFARSLGQEFDTLDALKDRIRKDLSENFAQQKDAAVKGQILDKLRELVEFEAPGSLVEREVDAMVEDFKNRLKQSGMDPDVAGLKEDALRDDFKAQAENKVRAAIVLGKVADLEEVDVEEADLESEFNKLAEGMGQPAEIIRDFYTKNNMLERLVARMVEEKTLQAIKASANITIVEPEELGSQA